MGDVKIYQSIKLTATKVLAADDDPVQTDFDMPAEVLDDDTYNEDLYARFVVAPSTTDLALPMGTVSTGTLLAINPDLDIKLKIANATVPSPTEDLTIKGGRWTVLHVEFTGLKVTNSSSSDSIKGRYFIAGDID